MLKSDIIAKLHDQHPKLKKQAIKNIVEEIFGHFSRALVSKQRIEIRFFGCFSVRQINHKRIRNPHNNSFIDRPYISNCVYFRPSKNLVKQINVKLNSRC